MFKRLDLYLQILLDQIFQIFGKIQRILPFYLKKTRKKVENRVFSGIKVTFKVLIQIKQSIGVIFLDLGETLESL